MPYPGLDNYARPRGGSNPIRGAVDSSITPPLAGAKAGDIFAGEMVYLTPAFKLASLTNSDPQIAAGSTISVVAAAGAATVTVSPALGNIVVGQSVAIGGASPETVVVTATNPGANTFTATFANTHVANTAISTAKANFNAQFFVGVAMSNAWVEVVPPVGGPTAATPRGAEEMGAGGQAGQWWVQFREAGDFRFLTTNGDTLNAFDKVYLGADGRTVQKTANGTYLGRVSPDQQAAAGAGSPPGVAPGTAITGAAGQEVIIRITPALV